MAGGNLEQLIADKSRELSWPVRIRLACDIAKGLKYVHSRGIMHRDLASKVCRLTLSEIVCFCFVSSDSCNVNYYCYYYTTSTMAVITMTTMGAAAATTTATTTIVMDDVAMLLVGYSLVGCSC